MRNHKIGSRKEILLRGIGVGGFKTGYGNHSNSGRGRGVMTDYKKLQISLLKRESVFQGRKQW